jgi:hypothetical protein
MFGHHDDNHQPEQDNDNTPVESAQGAPQTEESQHPMVPDQFPQDNNGAQDAAVVQPDPATPLDMSATDSAQDSSQVPAWQHPGAPLDSSKEQITDVISPAGGFPKRPSYQYSAGKPVPEDPGVDEANPANRELIDVKDHALDELAPLLDKLDLPPEEKFRAIMMILQANDDKSLVKAAYAAAHAIEDEETRARALYTVVNEVDYFTHQGNEEDSNG